MLPKLNTPIYQITLPIAKKQFEFRPFLVKEQKILLLANESDDPIFLTNNLKQVIKNCCLDDTDVDSLSSVDIEYIFINLRARSVGETIETKYRCQNQIGDDTCNNLMEVNIDLLDIKPNTDSYNDIIELTKGLGMRMRYPDFDTIKILTDSKSSLVDKTFDAIYQCIDYIFDDSNFYYKKEVPKQEVIEFLESLSIDQFKKIENFFASLPKIEKDVSVKCSKCGFNHKIHLEGLESFLG